MKVKYKLALFALTALSAITTFAKPNYVVNAESHITNQSMQGGLCYRIPSQHQIYISNPTSRSLTYRMEYITCVGTGCTNYTEYKTLSPNTNWSNIYVNGHVHCAHYGKELIDISAETYIYGEYISRVTNYAKLTVN